MFARDRVGVYHFGSDSCVQRRKSPEPGGPGIAAFPGVVAMSALDQLVTSPQAIAYFKMHGVTVTKQLIYRWRELGHLREAGRNQQEQPLYRLRDVLEAEKKSRRNKYSSRRKPQLIEV